MIQWVSAARSFRLDARSLEDGWAWGSWEELGEHGWFDLSPPALENTRRRFRTRAQAEDFFCLLAELLLDLPDTTTFPVRARPNAYSRPVGGNSNGA